MVPVGAATKSKWAGPADWEDDSWEDVVETGPSPEPPHADAAGTTVNASTDAATAQAPASSPESSPGKPTSVTSTAMDESSSSLKTELDAVLQRAKTAELKLFAITRERDTLRRTRDSRSADVSLVKQKDEQIKAVLAEGEKLSIKIAEKEGAVRTLRQRVSELEGAVEAGTNATSAAEAAAEAATTRARSADIAQRAAVEAKDAAEARLRAVQSETRAATQTSATADALRVELDAAKKGAADAIRATEARLTTAHAVADAQRAASAADTERNLSKALDELRARVAHESDAAGAREDRLRRDAAALRERAAALEERNEELAAAVPESTRPLLRQIDALQAAAAERARAAAAAERALVARARAADAAAAAAAEREKAADERAATASARAAAAAETARGARSRADAADAELAAAKDAAADETAKLRRDARAAEERARTANVEADDARASLLAERASNLDAADAAEARERTLSEKVTSLEAALALAREQAEPSTPRAVPLNASRDSFLDIAAAGPLSGGSPSPFHASFSAENFVDAASTAAVPNGLYATERMASALRQRSGEVASLQRQLSEKEEATRALAEEVVSLTKRADAAASAVGDAPAVKERLEGLERRHGALLELLGEREERIGELEADLSDVNAMYKEQINELLMRLEPEKP